MEDIGNLIYYIVIFVVAIVSWVRSSTKKKQQHQTALPSPFPTQDMPVIPPPAPRKKKVVPPPVPKHTRPESYPGSFMSSKYKDSPILMQEEEGVSLRDELELNRADDFRKAILYSEILNRKEW